MSDKPIQVGDLVICLRGHCIHSEAGKIFTVLALKASDETNRYCGACKKPITGFSMAKIVDLKYGWVPVSWLKRLDPDALKDDVPSDERITA